MMIPLPFSEQIIPDQALLREHFTLFLDEQYLPPGTMVGTDILYALEASGKLLSSPVAPFLGRVPSGIWALLSLHIARYCAPTADLLLVSRVALAVECFLCALDLLDDVEDDDQTPLRRQVGDARLLNTSTALISLASCCLLSLIQHGVSSKHVIRLLTILYEQTLQATVGQHQDLLAERRAMQEICPEDCLAIAEEKSGSLVRMACLLAAASVEALDTIEGLFSEVGTMIGTAYQLDNDICDLSHSLNAQPDDVTQPSKTDLAREKKTLPIVLAAERLAVYLQMFPSSDDEEKRAEQEQSLQARAYQEGLKASLAVGFYYRYRARSALQKIEALRGTSVPPVLRFLLSIDDLRS